MSSHERDEYCDDDDYATDDFEEDSEGECAEEDIEEEFDVVFFEDEFEIDYVTDCPFWILEAESLVGIESVPLDEQSAVEHAGMDQAAEEPAWLVDAEAALAVLRKLELSSGGANPTEEETQAKPKLVRSGSFQRRRAHTAANAPKAGSAAPLSAGEALAKPKVVRSGSFQRRRTAPGDSTAAMPSKRGPAKASGAEANAADSGARQQAQPESCKKERDVSPSNIMQAMPVAVAA